MNLDELNPLTLGDTPEEYIENSDGSVTIPDLEAVESSDTDFMDNLAETLDKNTLKSISEELLELIEKDKESRKKRDKQYQEGLRRTGLGDDAPGGAEFEGASKVVHPVLAEACIDFASRAIKELFPASGPVKPWIPGEVNPKKTEKANRKSRFMNWQLTTQITEYRDELEQTLTQVPMGGSQYQKFWHDSRMRRARVEFVPVDDIFLPYAATNFYIAQRVTHRQLLTRFEFNRRIDSGLYRDVFVTDGEMPESSDSAAANDKIEGRESDGYNEDGLRQVYEIYTWREIDEDKHSDGDVAPYIITIDEDTEEVLSVYRNWKEGDTRLNKLDWFVEWKFIPWRGAYALGLPHLIGGIAAALTGSLRALLDAAHINNAPTMLKLKTGRIVGQNTQVNVTQVCDIEGPANIDDIKKLAMPMPFNPPSPVLAGLMESLYGLAKGVVATAEDKLANVGDRTPVGTTMALIEQGSNVYSAIHARLHESQKKSLEILHRINADYLEDESFEEFGDGVTSDDFQGVMDIIPVSDPTIFSEAQRFAQNQAIMQMAAADAQNPNIKWDQIAIRRRMLKQMRIDDVDTLLPAPKEPITADVLTENTEASKAIPLKAEDSQNHMAHIQGHLTYIESPMVLTNPMVPPQMVQGMLGHIQEHIQLYVAQLTLEVAKQMLSTGAIDHVNDNDEVLALATAQAQQAIVAQFQPIMQRIGAVQQQLQQKMPKPPLPPEVQASIQIAQMETQRRTQMDQATLQFDAQKEQSKSQLEQAKMNLLQQQNMTEQQMKQAQQQFEQQMEAAAAQLESTKVQFDQRLEQTRFAAERQAEQLVNQVEMMKNEADNHQKQMTELLKNRDDNETKIAIEQMSQQLNSITETGQVDITPHLEQMNELLTQIGKRETDNALASVMQGLQATIQTLNKPKTIIRDAQGKAQGIQ